MHVDDKDIIHIITTTKGSFNLITYTSIASTNLSPISRFDPPPPTFRTTPIFDFYQLEPPLLPPLTLIAFPSTMPGPNIPKILMAGGAVGFGYYLVMRPYWFPNPYKTREIQNVEDRFTAGGGTPTHAPGVATKLGESKCRVSAIAGG